MVNKVSSRHYLISSSHVVPNQSNQSNQSGDHARRVDKRSNFHSLTMYEHAHEWLCEC